MITGKDLYEVLSALVPLYVAMILAYGSVRWWKIFTPDQCSGINRFVAVFAVPFLNFHFISSDNLYAMNLRFIAADSLQKVVILVAVFLWQCLRKHGDLGWTITLFSLSTLPNTLVLGIPLLGAMYGEFSGNLMVQIVVLQAVVWYTLLLFLFEYRAAKELISQQIPPELASEITSFRVESDVRSLGGSEPVLAETEVGQDGKIQMVVRKSTSHDHNSVALMNLRASLSRGGMELHSFQWATLPEETPGALEEMKTDYFSVSSDKVTTPRHSLALSEGGAYNSMNMSYRRTSSLPNLMMNRGGRVASVDFEDSPASNETAGPTGEMHMKDGCKRSSCRTPLAGSNVLARRSSADVETGEQGGGNRHSIPSGVMTRLIVVMVWRKLVRNPNTYASFIGLVWSLISFRWNVEMPKIVKGSISVVSNTGLGMAMFSLGLFMALQPNIVACGKSAAALAMAVRFLVGPAVTGATSAAIGIRHDLLRVSIVQAALPGGIVPFVFAKEYSCYAAISSTSVVFGMLLALPVTIVYYFLLGL